MLECQEENESDGSLQEAPDMLLSPIESDSVHFNAGKISVNFNQIKGPIVNYVPGGGGGGGGGAVVYKKVQCFKTEPPQKILR